MIHRLCLAFEALDLDEGAAVVNVAAVAGVFEGGGGDPWYATAKAGIAGYTKSGGSIKRACAYELCMPGRSYSYSKKSQCGRRGIYAAFNLH